jgi:branched-chain amino acid transport system ATP-binding protein
MTQAVAELSQKLTLEISSVSAAYGRARVLRDVSLQVPESSAVALLGANGAGKTTTMRVAAGLVRPTAGHVYIAGQEVTGESASTRARLGLCLIPEGRGIFRSLTVKENLELQIPSWSPGRSLDEAFGAFPILGKRLSHVAGSLSGGEQQMLALSRAYLADPRVILLDEISLGLSPIVLDQIFESLMVLKSKGAALLIVEQYMSRALQIADTAYLMTRGFVAWRGPANELDEEQVASSYLGRADSGQ